MKSIRRSLIVYFLVLMTAALGAMSWFSYQMTEESLRQRQTESRSRMQAQCEALMQDARADLDRRLLRQAQAMANLSKSAFVHAEPHFGLFGLLAAPALPSPHLNAAMFAYQISHEKMAPAIFWAQPLCTTVPDADKLVAEEGEHAQEFFQMYRQNGSPVQRSESMGDEYFTLEESVRKGAALLTEHFDDVEMERGVKVRRVTLKTNVPSYETYIANWPFTSKVPIPQPTVFAPGKAKGGVTPKSNPNKGGKLGGKGGTRPVRTPTIFIQYAADLAPTEAKIAEFQRQRDHQIAEMGAAIEENLRELRGRMMWIAMSSLAALWLGGFVVIRMGLAPLSKMSEAVSQVSPTNFHLPLETAKLPRELQPIAERLVVSLDLLKRAFAREKQASADISHELRTPLAALMTTLEVALRKTRSAEEYREVLEDCRASGQHMYQLVERLLTLARLDAGVDQYRPRAADVTDIALACADLIRPLAKARGIALRLHVSDPITTTTDPDKLREILTNLLHNAVEYNNPNGAIDLTIERVNGSIRFEVRDTGIGIKPESMEHLFKRFYRADPSRHADTPHAGLGLSIVKSYVDLMGGTVQVESNGSGTAFIVELPYLAPEPNLATTIQPELELAQR